MRKDAKKRGAGVAQEMRLAGGKIILETFDVRTTLELEEALRAIQEREIERERALEQGGK